MPLTDKQAEEIGSAIYDIAIQTWRPNIRLARRAYDLLRPIIEAEVIESVLRIRCIAHRHIEQLNTEEASGGECGACVERDTINRAAGMVCLGCKKQMPVGLTGTPEGSLWHSENGYYRCAAERIHSLRINEEVIR